MAVNIMTNIVQGNLEEEEEEQTQDQGRRKKKRRQNSHCSSSSSSNMSTEDNRADRVLELEEEKVAILHEILGTLRVIVNKM